MSYTRRFRGLGDTASDQAAAASKTLSDMQKWSPTGFYTPDQINQIYDAIRNVEDSISTAIDKYIATGQVVTAPSLWNTITAPLTAALDAAGSANIASAIPQDLRSIQSNVQSTLNTFLPYIQAAGTAKAHGVGVVDAAGLRRTVVNALAIYQTATVAVASIQNIVQNAGGIWVYIGELQQVLTKVAGVVWDAAKDAGTQLLKVPDTIGTLLKVAKWGGLALAGVLLYDEVEKRRGRT